MLAVYVDLLSELFGVEKREGQGREELKGEIMARVLRETEKFISVNLDKKEQKSYSKELAVVNENGDVEAELRLLVKNLMKIPDVKFKLDNWMRAVIAEISHSSLKLVTVNAS